MGLFDKLKKESKEEPVEVSRYKQEWVNVTSASYKDAGAIREDGSAYYSGVRISENDGKIVGSQGKTVIFEVTKRSKAYKEIEPFKGRIAHDVVLYETNGDYGKYYKMRIRFEA